MELVDIIREEIENMSGFVQLQRCQAGDVNDVWDFNVVNGQNGEGIYAFLAGDRGMKDYYCKNGENLHSFKVEKKYVKDLSKQNLDYWGVKEFIYNNPQYKAFIFKHSGPGIPSSREVLITDPEVIVLDKGVDEDFQVSSDTVSIVKPFDTIKKYNINGRMVYSLFGNVDYYGNRESILAIKGKSNQLALNQQSYSQFLDELKRRFYSISDLADSDLLVSVQTSSNINDDIMRVLQKPNIKDGFKKNNSSFKMRSVKLSDRENINNMFTMNFNAKQNAKICVVDDFITTGTSFRNAFDILPETMKSVGVCLFKLES